MQECSQINQFSKEDCIAKVTNGQLCSFDMQLKIFRKTIEYFSLPTVNHDQKTDEDDDSFLDTNDSEGQTDPFDRHFQQCKEELELILETIQQQYNNKGGFFFVEAPSGAGENIFVEHVDCLCQKEQ